MRCTTTLSGTALVLALTLLGLAAYGCRTTSTPAAAPGGKDTRVQVTELSGPQAWAENCGRCHNLRDPASYSSQQWEIAVSHMRLRAQLTGQQEKAIEDFLASK